MAMKIATMGLVLVSAVIALVAIGLGALVATQSLSSTGNINVVAPPSVQLGVFQDSGCTVPISSVDWGTLNPNATATSTIYLKNEGNVPVTLSISSGDWSPSSAQDYLGLTWNIGDSYQLAASTSVQAVLSLTVSGSISGITSFSFNITITATQA